MVNEVDMPTKQLNEAINQYRKDGLSFIPIPFGEKAAAIKWQNYQEHQPTELDIKSWFNGHETNIAVITGAVSGNLVVLDCDNWDRFGELDYAVSQHTGIPLLDFTRISQTSKGAHIWLRTKQPVKSAQFPKLDIKGEGGYVVAPPSKHPTGVYYQFLNNLPIKTIESLKDIGIDIEQKDEPERPGNQPGWVNDLLRGVSEGSRNDTAVKLCGYFRNLLPIEVTTTIMEDWNKRNSPPPGISRTF